MTAGNIAEQFSMSKPSISHHLDLLKQAGLISQMKKGQFRYYSLNMTVLDEVINWAFTLKSEVDTTTAGTVILQPQKK